MLTSLLMWNKIGRIVTLLSDDLGISPEQALEMFYLSRTNELMRDPEAQYYTFGDRYLADEIIGEQKMKNAE